MPLERIIEIETSLANRLTDEWQPLYESYATRLLTALKLGNTRAAESIADSLNLAPMIATLGDALTSHTKMAFQFGALQVSKYPSAVNDLHDEAVDVLKSMVMTGVVDQTKKAALSVIADFDKVQKAEETSILHEFKSFAAKVKTQAERNLRMATNLHTMRLAGYGFTAEANVMGLTRYAINGSLDKKICPVCRVQHGRIFEVSDARALYQKVLKTKDPNKLKELQPWPSVTEAENMVKMLPQDLVEKGWHIPPFHGNCRCLLSKTGNVPAVSMTPSAQAVGWETKPYVPNKWDFVAAGLPADPHILEAWGEAFKISPMRLLSKLFKTEEGLITNHLLAGRGIGIKLSSREMQFKVNSVLFDSKFAIQYQGSLSLAERRATLDMLAFAEEDAELGKEVFGAAIDGFKAAGAKVVEVNANIGQGSYGMSKYGYIPTSDDEWLRLKNNWIKKPWKKMKGTLPKIVQDTVDTILNSPDRFAIWELSDIGYKVDGVPLGQKLLQDTQWWGELHMDDPQAMQRFTNYFG